MAMAADDNKALKCAKLRASSWLITQARNGNRTRGKQLCSYFVLNLATDNPMNGFQ